MGDYINANCLKYVDDVNFKETHATSGHANDNNMIDEQKFKERKKKKRYT